MIKKTRRNLTALNVLSPFRKFSKFFLHEIYQDQYRNLYKLIKLNLKLDQSTYCKYKKDLIYKIPSSLNSLRMLQICESDLLISLYFMTIIKITPCSFASTYYLEYLSHLDRFLSQSIDSRSTRTTRSSRASLSIPISWFTFQNPLLFQKH